MLFRCESTDDIWIPDKSALNEAEHEGEVPFRVTLICVTQILKDTYINTALHDPTMAAYGERSSYVPAKCLQQSNLGQLVRQLFSLFGVTC